MTIDEILEIWRIDSKIEQTNLVEASLEEDQLHHKYEKL